MYGVGWQGEHIGEFISYFKYMNVNLSLFIIYYIVSIKNIRMTTYNYTTNFIVSDFIRPSPMISFN